MRDCSTYKNVNSTQKTKHKNGPLGSSSSGVLHGRERKKDNMLNISTPSIPSDRGIYERSPGTAQAPMILLGDFNPHNQLW